MPESRTKWTTTVCLPVFLPAVIVAFFIVVGTIANPPLAAAVFAAALAWVTTHFGWFYMLSVAIFLVFIIGVAYKAEINDTRDSPGLKIFESLIKKNYAVDYHDPYVKKIRIKNKTYYSKSIKKCSQYNFVVICTDHKCLPLDLIIDKSVKIYDTRGVFKNFRDPKIIQC